VTHEGHEGHEDSADLADQVSGRLKSLYTCRVFLRALRELRSP